MIYRSYFHSSDRLPHASERSRGTFPESSDPAEKVQGYFLEAEKGSLLSKVRVTNESYKEGGA